MGQPSLFTKFFTLSVLVFLRWLATTKNNDYKHSLDAFVFVHNVGDCGSLDVVVSLCRVFSCWRLIYVLAQHSRPKAVLLKCDTLKVGQRNVSLNFMISLL